MKKDLETANRFIEKTEAASRFSSECLQIWQAADSALGKGADHTAIYKYIREL